LTAVVAPTAVAPVPAAAAAADAPAVEQQDAGTISGSNQQAQTTRQGHRLTRLNSAADSAQPQQQVPVLPPPATPAPAPASSPAQGDAASTLQPAQALRELGFTDDGLNALVLDKFGGNVTIAAANLQAITDRSAELAAMGFADTAANLRLLLKHDNSLDAAVNDILTTPPSGAAGN